MTTRRHTTSDPGIPSGFQDSGNVDELLGGVTLDEHVAVIQSLEVDFDDIGAGVVNPHTLTVSVTIKESLSHVSKFGGNSYRRVTARLCG